MFWEKIKEASLRDCVLESARKGIKRRLDTSSCFDKNRKNKSSWEKETDQGGHKSRRKEMHTDGATHKRDS